MHPARESHPVILSARLIAMIDTHTLDRMLGDDWRHYLPPVCMDCGYNLAGSVSDRCPECGVTVSRRQMERYVSNLKIELRLLEHVGYWVQAGVVLAAVAISVLGLGFVLAQAYGPTFLDVARVVSCLLAFPAFWMGLSIIRIYRLPAWARDWVSIEPPVGRSMLAIALSLITGVAAMLL